MAAGQPDWDIVSGIGITALGAAAMRAVESRRAAPLVRDPHAAAFVAAVADQLPRPVPLTREEAAADPSLPWIPLADHMAVRSKFFDRFFSAAAGDGVRQMVILAAGLDTRAFRLDWSSGTTVYEIDVPMVLEFKDAVLAAHGAVPGDLREDWPAALTLAGFDPVMPTAWLAEGLFPYLPDEAIDALLGHVHALSAPGSLIAIEHLPGGTSTLDDALSQPITTGENEELAALWSAGQQHDPSTWLRRHGWTVDVSLVTAVAADYGRPMTGTELASLHRMQFITGQRPL
jgi:methyltransferase (TIGR00027 family)